MPSLRTTTIAGTECKVVITMPLYTWQAKGDFQGQPVAVAGFKTESEAFRAWKLAAGQLVKAQLVKAQLAKTVAPPASSNTTDSSPV